MLGQEVTSLFNGNAKPGVYTLNWNGLDHNGNMVSSGSYIYKMIAGEFVQSKKMMFVK
jgi:flagellar hook assembly protein FlgD